MERGDDMKYSPEIKMEATKYFDKGFGAWVTARALGVNANAVMKWFYTYRALGKEALLMTKRRTFSHDTKVRAARAVVEEGMTKLEAMEKFSLKSRTQIETWCRLYREGGADALLPKPKGRPKKGSRTFASREEELEARVQELELENEILKRINALADEIEQKRQTR